ncbi:MAG: hypothetical protein ACPGJS_00720 [Flammeovirgaceae bacterium]
MEIKKLRSLINDRVKDIYPDPFDVHVRVTAESTRWKYLIECSILVYKDQEISRENLHTIEFFQKATIKRLLSSVDTWLYGEKSLRKIEVE